MPDRVVRAGIITSEAVNALSWPAEVFYRRLMSVVDDYGRYDGRMSLLRASLYPLKLDRIIEPDIGKWIAECREAGLVRIYSVEGKPYIEIIKFGQRVRSASKWPAGPGSADNCQQLTTNASVFVCESVFGSECVCESVSDARARGDPTAGEPVIPTVEEVVQFGAGPPGIPADYCQHYHAVGCERHRWVTRQGKLVDWRKEVVRWWSQDRATWGKSSRGKARASPTDRRTAKAAREYPEPELKAKVIRVDPKTKKPIVLNGEP